MALSRSCRAALAPIFRPRHFHTCSVLAARQQAAASAAPTKARRTVPNLEPLPIDEDALMDQRPAEDDAPEPMHKYLQQQREMLYYLRLIEHEMPKLVAYRKPFVPPDASNPLVIRTISYGGEQHPAAVKRTIVVPNADAIHKFKVLAGVRWTPHPPADSGIGPAESGSEHGFFKIACEDFPKGAMNLKWASDTLDRLLVAANVRVFIAPFLLRRAGIERVLQDLKEEKFADIPVDTRHVEAKTRKAKKGGHIYGKQTHRPSIRDFPKEWLPVANPQAAPEPSASA
ncbi:hypothetical protein C8T65DRAFT_631472 [Cerioporus squamosus]|nr:hypothetical protein C8T65DRAFT_631472 [Cerioporus squamosus]